jgi:hypothetical protein
VHESLIAFRPFHCLAFYLLAKAKETTAMSPIPVKTSEPSAFSGPLTLERRSKLRFPLELRVSYRTLGQEAPCTGEGWVLNMSRGGILVFSQHEIELGARTELNIEWPSLLYGRIPLRFVTEGTVVRCDPSSFAMVMARYQFRTTKKKVTSIDALGRERC